MVAGKKDRIPIFTDFIYCFLSIKIYLILVQEFFVKLCFPFIYSEITVKILLSQIRY